jgi:hypothetical protein
VSIYRNGNGKVPDLISDRQPSRKHLTDAQVMA